MKFCENCGSQLPDEAVFCACCGNQVPAATSSEDGAVAFTPVTPKKKPNKKKLGIMIGAAALVLVIGIGAAIGLGWYFGDEQKLSRAMKSGDLDAVKELVNGVNYYYYPVMEVLAEAIQADGEIDGTPAVTNAWGVTIDSTGKITAVP